MGNNSKILKEWDNNGKLCQERQIECGCIESNVYSSGDFKLLTACDEHGPWTEKTLNDLAESWETNYLLRVRPYSTTKESELPYVVDVQVYECFIIDDEMRFQKKGSLDHPNYEAELKNAEMYLEGSIKWDGCSNVRFLQEGYLHFCGSADAIRIGDIMKELYNMASALMQRELI